MRFAYIDSSGNEVPIPSVDALALRIELGAVGPDTQLYDAQEGRWGPAHTHEIFHTLSRERGQDGFVPPPPPVPPLPPPAAPARPSGARPAAKAVEPAPAPPPPGGFDLGLTLADLPPEPAEAAPAEPFDLAVEPSGPPPSAPASGAKGDAETAGPFGLADRGGALELEIPSGARSGSPSGGRHGNDLALETPVAFTTGAAGVGSSSGLSGADFAAGPSASALGPGAGAGWSADPAGEPPLDFSAVMARVPAKEEPLSDAAVAPQRRTPKDRPSPPKFRKQRNVSAPLFLFVLVFALAVGGYWGWPLLSQRLARPSPPEPPAPALAQLPPELLERLRALAGAAFAEAVREVDRSTAPGVPGEPDREWLRGRYLAGASDFPTIASFWNGIGQLVQGARAADGAYPDRLIQRIRAEALPPDTAALLAERARAGLAQAAAMRERAYASMQALVDAALDLHDFLVANDARIEYRPATTSTADPILEALPATPALGREMEERIGAYTDALDEALGTIDRVTRERLVQALVSRLQQVGIQ